jgi:predicted Zn-dependent peptidase
MTQIRITTLDNGLRIASDPIASVETASVGVWIEAGSRYETSSNSGVLYLLEHMVFKGTRRRDARAIAEEIEAVGGHINAHTSREYTAFYAKVLKDDVGLALDVISDMVQHSLLDAAELSRERTVVIQEIMQANDTPDDIIFDRFQAAAFPDQPIGRSVLGSADLIDDMSRDVLVRYMLENYGAGRMIVAAAGNVDHDRLVELAAAAFDTLPYSATPKWEKAQYRGGEWREERDLEQIHLVLGFPSIAYHDPKFYAMSVLSTLLGGGMSSRLFQEAREKRGLVYSIYTFPATYSDTGLFGIYAGTGTDTVGELVPLICDELLEVTRHIGDAEVARARAQLKSGILMSLESTSARCEQLARQLMVFGRPIPVSETVAKIDAVDASAARHVAAQAFGGSPTLAALGPVGTLPRRDAIADRLSSIVAV